MLKNKYPILTGEDPVQSHDITEEIHLQAIQNIARLKSMERKEFKNWDWKNEIGPKFNT